MLKTTEQAIWSAKLSKFSRGRPAPPGLSTDHSPSSQASLLPVSWQHFSGPDLLCTVTFSTHKSSCEPSHIPAGASQPYDGLQSASISDRQFRIAVGWASNVAHSVSASLNALVSQNQPCRRSSISDLTLLTGAALSRKLSCYTGRYRPGRRSESSSTGRIQRVCRKRHPSQQPGRPALQIGRGSSSETSLPARLCPRIRQALLPHPDQGALAMSVSIRLDAALTLFSLRLVPAGRQLDSGSARASDHTFSRRVADKDGGSPRSGRPRQEPLLPAGPDVARGSGPVTSQRPQPRPDGQRHGFWRAKHFPTESAPVAWSIACTKLKLAPSPRACLRASLRVGPGAALDDRRYG